MKCNGLSPNELSILQLLWAEGHSLSRPEILEKLPDKDWNPNSIHLILNNMIKKGVLQIDGITRCGRGYGRTYAPTISQSEYILEQVNTILPDTGAKKRLNGIMAALLGSQDIDEQALTEMEELLEKKREELKLQ